MKFVKTLSFNLAVYIKGNIKAQKLALVLPGKLDTKDYPHMRSHVDFLASKGYLALSFDPPGTWESSGGIELYTMTNYLKAINELIAHFGNLPTVLMGHSRGGSMAMLAGTQNRFVTHIIAAMSNTAPIKMSDKGKKQGFETSYRDTPSGAEKKFLLPLGYFTDADKFDLLAGLAKCSKPKLYILGRRDKTVTPSEVKKVYEKSAEPKKLYEVDSDHNYRRYPDLIDEINTIMGKFLDEFKN